MHVDGNKEDSVDDSVDSVDSGGKHLTHLSQAVDCCFKERSVRNMHVDSNKDNGVEDSVDNSAVG
eukprot:58295-Ditylum_brightwellii.AAC.1